MVHNFNLRQHWFIPSLTFTHFCVVAMPFLDGIIVTQGATLWEFQHPTSRTCWPSHFELQHPYPTKVTILFLAPPARRQRGFSNADSSASTFHLKDWFLKNGLITDDSKGNFSWFERSEKGQICVFFYFLAIFSKTVG